jgi:hypothetical protein
MSDMRSVRKVATTILLLSLGACATYGQSAGTAAGVVGGAVVAGPIGAVVGGVAGAVATAPGGPMGSTGTSSIEARNPG